MGFIYKSIFLRTVSRAKAVRKHIHVMSGHLHTTLELTVDNAWVRLE